MTANAEILKHHGLTLLGFLILDVMCGTGDPETINDVSQADVAWALHLANNDARRAVMKLEGEGFLERVIAAKPRYGPSPKGEKVYREALLLRAR